MKLNFILPKKSTDLATGWHTHARAHTHKKCKYNRATFTWYTFDNTNAGSVTFKPYITRKVLNEKILYYSVLKSSRGKLQKYILKNWGFHLKNSKWSCPDLNNAT